MSQYDNLIRGLDRLEEKDTLAKAQKLLEDIIDSGKYITQSEKRQVLSNLAYDLRERIGQISGSYLSFDLVPPEPTIPSSNPFIYGRALQPEEFLGREYELRSVFSRLCSGQSTAIVGGPHIGKTSLLLQLADENVQQTCLGDSARSLLISYLDLHPIEDEYAPRAFWGDALKPLEERVNRWSIADHFEQVVQADYARRPLEQLFTRLGQNGRRLVLLLDEFERLLGHPNFQSPSFFALLRSLASRSGGLALVTASRQSVAQMNDHSRSLLEAGSPFFNIMMNIRLRPFDEGTVKKLLGLAGDAFSAADRHFIRRVAGRHPFLLQAMAATLLETHGDDRHPRAAQRFYDRVVWHFDDVWGNMNDRTRSTFVIFSLVALGGAALEPAFTCSEIKQADRFSFVLRDMAEQGLVERVGEGWPFDHQSFLLWQGERWTVGAQAFTWWVRDVVITESRQVPTYDEWLADQRYRSLLTQEQWSRLLNAVHAGSNWAARDVGAMAGALFEALVRRKK